MLALQEIDIPLTGAETPVMVLTLFVGYFLIPWLTSAVVKWDAAESEKAMYSVVLGVAAALAMEFGAGNPDFNSVATTAFTVLSTQYVGFKQFHKPLAGNDKPTVGAVAGGFGVGRSGSTAEQD